MVSIQIKVFPRFVWTAFEEIALKAKKSPYKYAKTSDLYGLLRKSHVLMSPTASPLACLSQVQKVV